MVTLSSFYVYRAKEPSPFENHPPFSRWDAIDESDWKGCFVIAALVLDIILIAKAFFTGAGFLSLTSLFLIGAALLVGAHQIWKSREEGIFLNSLNQQLEKLEQENLTLSETRSALQKIAWQLHNENKILQQISHSLKSEVDLFHQENEIFHQSNEKLTHSITRFEKENETLQKSNQKLNRQITRLEQVITAQLAEMERVHRLQDLKFQENIAALHQEILSLQEAKLSLTRSIEEAAQRFEQKLTERLEEILSQKDLTNLAKLVPRLERVTEQLTRLATLPQGQ